MASAKAIPAGTPSFSRYFGRNKMQYERFAFKVLASEHFDVYHYPEEEAAVHAVGKLILYARASAFPADTRILAPAFELGLFRRPAQVK